MIYFLRSPQTGYIKIGTTKDYHARLAQLCAEHGDLELLGLMHGTYLEEKALHQKFVEYWVHNAPGREWFEQAQEIFDYIAEHTHTVIPDKEPEFAITVSNRTGLAIKLLCKRYGVRKLDDALWLFIQDNDSELADTAIKIVELES